MIKKKILIVAGEQVWPPNIGGSCSVIFNLFNGIDEDMFHVLTSQNKELKKDSRKLKNKVFSFPPTRLSKLRLIWRLMFFENIIRYIYFGYRLIKNIKQYDKFLIIFPDTGSFIGGYILSIIFSKKFDIYLLDLLSETRELKFEKFILSIFEKKILNNAQNVFCMGGIKDYYSKKYYREYIRLSHCITDNYKVYNKNYELNTISYAGQIYGLSLDSLVVLVEALKLSRNNNISLKLYSNISYEELEKYNLNEDFVELAYIKDHNQLINRLSNSELLFSPIAFNSNYSDQSKTCFPAKTFDYIKAGRPIFIHARNDYYYSKYMKENNAAIISNSLEPNELMNDINMALGNKKLKRLVIQNAIKLLNKNHLSSPLQNKFIENIKS